MDIKTNSLQGVLVIKPKIYRDSRGFFMESWNERRYADVQAGAGFVQDNISFSYRGTLRGLHFQNPNAQGKLLSVLHGEVFDVAVDLRRNSPTFGRSEGVFLNEENKFQFYIPQGFAHGFLVLSEIALFHYKCTDYYSPKDELTIRWDDPDLAIQWPIREPRLSERDAKAPFLRDIPKERLFE